MPAHTVLSLTMGSKGLAKKWDSSRSSTQEDFEEGYK